jgi:hypothetical protein
VLDIYEDGAENHNNLAATVFNKEKPIRENVELLYDDKVYIFTIATKSLRGKVVGVRSVSIQLNMQPAADTRIIMERFHPDREIAVDEDDEASFETGVEVIFSETRIAPYVVSLSSLEDGQRHVPIEIVSAACERGWQVHGCTLRDGDLPVYCFRFQSPLAVEEEDEEEDNPSYSIELLCRHAIGFPANDAKLAYTVSGQGSASCKACCLLCIETKDDFEYYLKWMQEHDQDIPLCTAVRYADHPREGKMANTVIKGLD